jgi:hypothetical protein
MKKLLKIGGILAVVGILAAAYVWFFVYNKPHRNFETAKPDFRITAAECFANYSAHNGAIDYNGKMLELRGVPTKVETADSLTVLVFVFNEGMFGDEGIRCTMLPAYEDAVSNLDFQSEILVKGYCSGYNDTDVILQYCSIVKN